eukprot:jgi/Chrzof1/4697/Cz14g23070.t1
MYHTEWDPALLKPSPAAHMSPVKQSTATQAHDSWLIPAVTSSAADAVYAGMYGPWRIEREDLIEVWGYRAGITAAMTGRSLHV